MEKPWQDADKVDIIHRFITKDDISRSSKCKNDEERFIFALEIINRNSANLFNLECKQKDSQHSVRSRDDGDKSFMVGKYYEAVKQYTESIVYAVDSSEELALAYANRSAALFKLKKYADCIVDIERALNQKSSDRLNTKSKLYRRKGLCLLSLGRPGANSAFQEALVLLDKMNMNEDEMNKSRSELQKLISDSSTAVLKPSTNVMKYPLPEIVTPNSEIPCASDAVAVKYSKKYGRHLVATRKIKPGEILILEKPWFLWLYPEHMYKYCSHCLQISWNLVPCSCCVNMAYCSESCKNKAWDEYHEVECPIVEVLLSFDFSNVFCLSLRMVIMETKKGVNLNALKQELTKVDHHTDPRTEGFCNDGKFYSNQYRSLFSMLHNVHSCALQSRLSIAASVALVVCIVARESTIFGTKLKSDTLAKNPDVIFFGGLIMRHLEIIRINAFRFGASRFEWNDTHGDAILHITAIASHSCDPNTIHQWYAECMAVYAAHPIEQGDEISITYGPRFELTEKRKRQEYLNQWDFKCGCLPCTHNWALLENIPSYKTQALTQENKIKLDKVMQKFRINNTSIQKSIVENNPSMLNDLLEMIELLFQLARRPCKELTIAISMLRNYCAAADAIFDHEPVNLSKIATECLSNYLDFPQMLSEQ